MLLNSKAIRTDFLSLGDVFYSKVSPTPLKNPHWLHINDAIAQLLGLSVDDIRKNGLAIFSGQTTIKDHPSIAMVYSGHQFGGYSAQLGDGRALLLTQYQSKEGLLDIQLKGAGKTPYSRFGDGRAVLRSSIREYLAGEAMHALHIPTSRALCLVGSDEVVIRERPETGAIITRTAKTHIRFGHFEYFHYTDRLEALKQLADYVIEYFVPTANKAKNPYQALFEMSVVNTAKMIARWQVAGFAHGVMNTDNMSIIGETIDYGPYGFLDDYEAKFICNHSDTYGRYAFDEQPSIGLWNLNALGHALSSLLSEKEIKNTLALYEPTIVKTYAELMRGKFGFVSGNKNDQQLCSGLLTLMEQDKVDYTQTFRKLSHFSLKDKNPEIIEAFKQKNKISEWCEAYKNRLQQDNRDESERQSQMLSMNPKFIARNYLLQLVIERAEKGDTQPLDELFTILQSPFEEHSSLEHYAEPPPSKGKHLPISCSS